ncbi:MULTISPECIES: NAD(P)/FAD-dependent oxidoreductase [unclassified Janthinobacterium]|uniref:NAD(P)/FAD-dependent oxidoreductase n=1 Tax=unclassified Janthinobacterium TaxID=2610881 RepID=UPI000373B1CF|nr:MULTISPECIES: FAD-binding oxidoreductase [unclassified Janthinobacterium]MEC5163926.1 glycine/D-amino acid oxidase-like deaminating enzyme [Janthinobacterium sp. CG_S6]
MTVGADVLVIGAGIVGAACADELAARGLRVLVIESGTVGGGATAAGMGHLVAMDDNPAELALTRYSLELWRRFVADAPRRHEYSQCGTIWVAADDEELAAARAKQTLLGDAGVACELLDAAALAACEPRLRPGLAGGLRVGGDAVVYPPKSAQILLDRACARGAGLLRERVRGLTQHGVTLDNGARIDAGMVVVANGVGAAALLPELPLRPKKGHLMITDRYPGFVRHQLVELGYIKSAHAASGESVAFNVQPRPTGQLLIGSSRQFDNDDRDVDPRLLRRMLARAADYLPGLAQLHALRCWTGLRAASADGLPLIGPHPARRNVWLATGHEGLGITTSLATAQLLAAQLCGSAAPIAAAPYLPARFAQLAAHG